MKKFFNKKSQSHQGGRYFLSLQLANRANKNNRNKLVGIRPNWSNKNAQLPAENIVFLVVNIFIFAALLIFVWRSLSETSAIEETTAKKIALVIDGMMPGMEVNISIKELDSITEKNNFKDFPVRIINNKVNVRASSGEGYSFQFFSNLTPVISFNKNDPNKILTIKT